MVEYGASKWPLLSAVPRLWNGSLPAVLISGGVHGDEPAGVQAVLAFLENIPRAIREAVQIVALPCVNPSGFDRGTLQTAGGANLNRLFGVGSAQTEVRAIEDWLLRRAFRFQMTFDLHEVRPDYIGEGFTKKDNPRGAYLYEIVSDQSERIGRALIDALPSNREVCQWPTIYNDINDRGVISYPSGCRNEIYAQSTSFDAFLSDKYTGHAFTFETPTDWAINERIDTHLVFLEIALRRLITSAGLAPSADLSRRGC
jgi:hypothetical protein